MNNDCPKRDVFFSALCTRDVGTDTLLLRQRWLMRIEHCNNSY